MRISLDIDIPNNATSFDTDMLKRQLTDFAKKLIASSAHDHIVEKNDAITEDPFACFSGDWGGKEKTAHEISDELYSSRSFTRPVDIW